MKKCIYVYTNFVRSHDKNKIYQIITWLRGCFRPTVRQLLTNSAFVVSSLYVFPNLSLIKTCNTIRYFSVFNDKYSYVSDNSFYTLMIWSSVKSHLWKTKYVNGNSSKDYFKAECICNYHKLTYEQFPTTRQEFHVK